MSPSLLDFLKHILHECNFIIDIVSLKNKEQFLASEIECKAVVRSLEIIGEATKKLPMQFREENPRIQWREMAGMRDVLIHNYFGVDYDLVWNVATNNILELQDELKLIIEASENFQ
jgi:uncharacterized protein with HEPN domain